MSPPQVLLCPCISLDRSYVSRIVIARPPTLWEFGRPLSEWNFFFWKGGGIKQWLCRKQFSDAPLWLTSSTVLVFLVPRTSLHPHGIETKTSHPRLQPTTMNAGPMHFLQVASFSSPTNPPSPPYQPPPGTTTASILRIRHPSFTMGDRAHTLPHPSFHPL